MAETKEDIQLAFRTEMAYRTRSKLPRTNLGVPEREAPASLVQPLRLAVLSKLSRRVCRRAMHTERDLGDPLLVLDRFARKDGSVGERRTLRGQTGGLPESAGVMREYTSSYTYGYEADKVVYTGQDGAAASGAKLGQRGLSPSRIRVPTYA